MGNGPIHLKLYEFWGISLIHFFKSRTGRSKNCRSSFRVHSLSDSHRAGPLLVGLALLAASCGASGNTAVNTPASTATSGTSPSAPRLIVSPSTGLVGGQQLRVEITGFPQDATVMVYQCANTASIANSNRCSGSIYLYTASKGGASGPIIAQPSVGGAQSRTACQDQCVLAARVIKEGAKGPPSWPLIATSPLSFSTTGTSGLKDAVLQDLSWISTTEGWAMASQPCAAGLCVRVAHTTDGGANWEPLPEPPALIQGGFVNCSKAVCVSHIRFASSTIGYLFGPELLMTTNGGHTWQVQHGPNVETLKVSSDKVFRIAYSQEGCPGPCEPILQEAVPGSTSWRTLINPLTSPDRSASAQIVSSGSTIVVALYGSPAGPVLAQAVVYRSTDNGASWQSISDPCSGLGPGGKGQEEDLIDLAAAPQGFFAGLCSPHSGFATFVVSSDNAGQTWKIAGVLPKTQDLTQIAAASSSVIAVCTGATGGSGAFTTQILVSTDGGQHWTTAAMETQQITQLGVPAWLGFETPMVGRWIGGPHSLWSTNDGGLHWTRATFS